MIKANDNEPAQLQADSPTFKKQSRSMAGSSLQGGLSSRANNFSEMTQSLQYSIKDMFQEEDSLFPNFSHRFSPREIEDTDWYTIVHRKRIKRAQVPPNMLKKNLL